MSYLNEGIDAKAEVLSGDVADSLVYWCKENGAPIIPTASSAFVTILDSAGATKVARVAATISGSKLVHSQTWPTNSYPLAEDYIAVWEFASGGVSYADRTTFDIVRTKLPVLIDTSDLEELYPNLTKHLVSIGETDAAKFVRRAWSFMLDRIRAGGSRPSLILDRARLVNPGIQLAACLTMDALCRQPGDVFDLRARRHEKNFEALFQGLGSLTYDKDEDGTADAEPRRVNRQRAWV